MFEETADWHAHYFDQCMALGFAGVKVRLGHDVADDVEVVRTVREHVGPNMLIGVDSYWFHDPDTAIELTARSPRCASTSSRSPSRNTAWTGSSGWRAFQPIRIAVGERVYSPAAYAELAAAMRPAFSNPPRRWPAGSSTVCASSTYAERHSIEVIPHVGGPTVVGLAANLHWATAARVRLCEYDIDAHQPMITEIGDNPALALVDLQGGTITAPTGPGLGVHIDEDLLDAHPYVAGDTYADLFPERESGRSTQGTQDTVE